MSTAEQTRINGGQHVGHLLATAEQAGCNLAPTGDMEGRMRGKCPFHKQRGLRDQTLMVNPNDGFFQCRACNISGNPATFMAMIWGVAVTEAHEMLSTMNGETATTERPKPMAMRHPEQALEERFRRQNTHLLTVAARHFRSGLRQRATAAQYVRALGIPTYEARRARLGFAGHPGLIEALREGGCDEEEIKESPLIRETRDGGIEPAFYGAVAIPDTDVIGATKWFAMVQARPEQALLKRPGPAAMQLSGRRPYLLGTAAVRLRASRVVVTDDVRVHIILLTKGIASCYTLTRRDGRRIAQRITAKQPQSLELAMWDQGLATEIARNVRNAGRGRNITEWHESEIARLIDPDTRDLSRLMRREGRADTRLPG